MTKTIKDFWKIHNNSNIIICGCGTSAVDILPYKDDFIIIGVNDIGRLFTPKYLLVTDHPSRFIGIRNNVVAKTESDYMFTCVSSWNMAEPSKKVMFDLGSRALSNLDSKTKLDFFLNSPYVATMLAYKMGATNIGLIGVDFTDNHFYAKDGSHSIVKLNQLTAVNQAYTALFYKLKQREVNLFNLSKISVLTTIPKITIDEFKNI